jgi:hypothetical protein
MNNDFNYTNVFKIGRFFIAWQALRANQPAIQISIQYQNLKFIRGIMIILIFFKLGIAISIGREK